MTPVRAPDGEVHRVDSVPEAFAELVLGAMGAGSSGPDGYSLFLSGGATAERCYERLAGTTPKPDWSAWTSTWGTSGACPPMIPTPITTW